MNGDGWGLSQTVVKQVHFEFVCAYVYVYRYFDINGSMIFRVLFLK